MILRPLILKNTLESHKKRNLKTSMLFTVALAFLVFGGSSLLLVGNMVLGAVRSNLGADILVTSLFSDNYLPEKVLRAFLQDEISSGSDRITAHSFRGEDLDTYLENVFGDGHEFNLGNTVENLIEYMTLIPVDENYIDSCLIDYYIPKYGQPGIEFQKTRGKDDYVKALFSNEGLTDAGRDLDLYNVASRNITDTSSDLILGFWFDPLQQFKILVPEGIRDVLSLDGGYTVKMKLANKIKLFEAGYRVLIRGMPRKVPGFPYMSYKRVSEDLQGIISFPQAYQLVNLYARHSEETWAAFNKYNEDEEVSTWSYFFPKTRLLLRVNEDLSRDEREGLA
jgi:hypothetical protein